MAVNQGVDSSSLNRDINHSIDSKKESIPDLTPATPKSPKFKGWYLAYALDSLSKANVDAFMPIFARILGANASTIGFMSGLYSIVNVSQLFFAELSSKIGKSRVFVALGWFLSAILFVPMAFLKTGQMLLLLFIRFLQGIFTSAAVPTQASLMADHISQKERVNKISRFTAFGLTGALVGTLSGGFLFSLLADAFFLGTEITFTVLFIWTMLLGVLASLVFVASVPDYKQLETLDSNAQIQHYLLQNPEQRKVNLTTTIQSYLIKFNNFWSFCAFAGIFYFSVHLASPFFIIVEIEHYGFSFFEASLLTSQTTVIQIFFAVYLSRKGILDKIGRKIPIMISVIFISISTVAVIVPYYIDIPAFAWCVLAWVFLGTGWGVFNATVAVFLLDIAHPKYRSQLIASYNTLTGIAMFFGPVVGGIIIDFYNDIAIVFLLRGSIVLLTLIIFVKVKEPEISAAVVHPVRHYFTRYFRQSAGRGPVTVITQVRPQKYRYRNLYPFKKAKKQDKQN
ncbi:MAG: MFS transporter [Candidatus Odinarchaeota archaeon]